MKRFQNDSSSLKVRKLVLKIFGRAIFALAACVQSIHHYRICNKFIIFLTRSPHSKNSPDTIRDSILIIFDFLESLIQALSRKNKSGCLGTSEKVEKLQVQKTLHES